MSGKTPRTRLGSVSHPPSLHLLQRSHSDIIPAAPSIDQQQGKLSARGRNASFVASQPASLPTPRLQRSNSDIVGGSAETELDSTSAASSAVKVFVRVRPFNEREAALGAPNPIVSFLATTVTVYDPHNHFRPKDVYSFDACLWSIPSIPNTVFASQEKVYAMTGATARDNALEGYNACIFAYGQTGSGKSFTMMGSIEEGSQRGIIPRLCADLVDASRRSATSLQLMCTYLEIYNEKVMDLLEGDQQDLKVRQDPITGPFVEGLSTHSVTSEDDVYRCLQKGDMERHTAATKMNDRSSRSHAIFTLLLCKNASTQVASAKINLVDLAGSERASSSGVEGVHFKEATKINLSLTTLGRVIDALADRSSGKSSALPPYRESMLTWVLSDSLGGNSKTCMIAAISPSSANYEETINTLRYAARAREIVNICVLGEDPSQRRIQELTVTCEQLRRKLSAAIHGGGTTTTNQQIAKQLVYTKEYVDELEAKITSQQALLEELKAKEESVNSALMVNRVKLGEKMAMVEGQGKRDEKVIKSLRKEQEELTEKLKQQGLDNARELQALKEKIVVLTKQLKDERAKAVEVRAVHDAKISQLESDLRAMKKLNMDLQQSSSQQGPTPPPSLWGSPPRVLNNSAPASQTTPDKDATFMRIEQLRVNETLKRQLSDAQASTEQAKAELAEVTQRLTNLSVCHAEVLQDKETLTTKLSKVCAHHVKELSLAREISCEDWSKAVEAAQKWYLSECELMLCEHAQTMLAQRDITHTEEYRNLMREVEASRLTSESAQKLLQDAKVKNDAETKTAEGIISKLQSKVNQLSNMSRMEMASLKELQTKLARHLEAADSVETSMRISLLDAFQSYAEQAHQAVKDFQKTCKEREGSLQEWAMSVLNELAVASDNARRDLTELEESLRAEMRFILSAIEDIEAEADRKVAEHTAAADQMVNDRTDEVNALEEELGTCIDENQKLILDHEEAMGRLRIQHDAHTTWGITTFEEERKALQSIVAAGALKAADLTTKLSAVTAELTICTEERDLVLEELAIRDEKLCEVVAQCQHLREEIESQARFLSEEFQRSFVTYHTALSAMHSALQLSTKQQLDAFAALRDDMAGMETACRNGIETMCQHFYESMRGLVQEVSTGSMCYAHQRVVLFAHSAAAESHATVGGFLAEQRVGYMIEMVYSLEAAARRGIVEEESRRALWILFELVHDIQGEVTAQQGMCRMTESALEEEMALREKAEQEVKRLTTVVDTYKVMQIEAELSMTGPFIRK